MMKRLRHKCLYIPYVFAWVAIQTIIAHGVIPHHHHLDIGDEEHYCEMESPREETHDHCCTDDHHSHQHQDSQHKTEAVDISLFGAAHDPDCDHSCVDCHFHPELVQTPVTNQIVLAAPEAAMNIEFCEQVSIVLHFFEEIETPLTFYESYSLRGPPVSA